MALQNARALLWRGEDLGFGNGNSREAIVSTLVGASARPLIMTRSFVGSVDITALLATASPWPSTGKHRILVNRSQNYWLTCSGSMFTTNTSTSVPCSFPIAPLQMFFLPINFGGTVTLNANSAWPVPVPLTGAPGQTVPQATALMQQTFDLVVEQ